MRSRTGILPRSRCRCTIRSPPPASDHACRVPQRLQQPVIDSRHWPDRSGMQSQSSSIKVAMSGFAGFS